MVALMTPELWASLNRSPADVGNPDPREAARIALGEPKGFTLNPKALAALARLKAQMPQAAPMSQEGAPALPQQPPVEAIGSPDPGGLLPPTSVKVAPASNIHMGTLVAPPEHAQVPGVLNKSNRTNTVTGKNSAEQAGNHIDRDPNELATILKLYGDLPAFKDQSDSLNNQAELIKSMANRPAGIDWGPLNRLSDSWYGTKLSQGYKAPESPSERADKIMAMNQQLQNDRRDQQRNLLNAAIMFKTGGQSVKNAQSAGQTQVASEGSQTANIGPSVGKFAAQTFKESHDLQTNDEQLQKVLVAVNSWNPAEQKSAPPITARILEGGRPALMVIANESGNPSWIEKMKSFYAKVDAGTMTAENVAEFSQMVQDMKNVNKQKWDGLLPRWKATARGMNIPDDTADAIVNQNWVDPYKDSTKSIMDRSPVPKDIHPPKGMQMQNGQVTGGGKPKRTPEQEAEYQHLLEEAKKHK